MKFKNEISKVLSLTIFLASSSISSFANNIFAGQYDSENEIVDINTKEDLEVYTQKSLNSKNSGSWVTGLSNMPSKRSYFSAQVVNGKIYCIGGYDGSSYLNTVEVYDPITDTWDTSKTPMPTPRYDFASGVIDGKIYCIGGYNLSGPLNKVEIYDPSTDTWNTEKTLMPTARYGLCSAVLGGKIYCIGGRTSTTNLNVVEVYDPATDMWDISVASLPASRSRLRLGVVDGKIYAIGGYNGSYLNKVEVYDPITDTWDGLKTPMPTARDNMDVVVVDDKIYCIGGSAVLNGSYATVGKLEVYSPKTDTWETKIDMPTPRTQLSSVYLNGRVYCIGGVDSLYTNKVEAYILPVLISSNIDVYIKPQSILSVSLNTNKVVFEEFDGVNNMEISGALELSVESNLPYDINAILESEIGNSDNTKVVDKSILGIKASNDNEYKSFFNIGEKVALLNNVSPEELQVHPIDIRLNTGVPYKTDVYKTAIKFEIVQR